MYYVHVTEFSDGSDPSEYELSFNTLGDAWDYIHIHQGYHEYLLDNDGYLTPFKSGSYCDYWTDYSCSHVYTR